MISSGSEGKLSGSEVGQLLLLSHSSPGSLVLGESSPESSGLLQSQVSWSALVLVIFTSLVSSLLVNHSEHLSDGLSDKLKKVRTQKGLPLCGRA